MKDRRPVGESVASDALARWQRPELRKLKAGSAENGNGLAFEGGFGAS